MKIALMSVASAIFIFGSCFAGVAREVVTLHGDGVTAERQLEHRDAALEPYVLCSIKYLQTRDDRGWYMRRSVDCEQ